MTYLRKIARHQHQGRPFPGGIAAGCNLRTPCGPRRVEWLRPGDLLVTRDNGLQPVRRIWQWRLTDEEMAEDPARVPLRFGARALGPMMPARPVRLAPDQRLLVPGYRIAGQQDTPGCLLRAGDLAGQVAAVVPDRPARPVRYFVLLFDSHQLVCADGVLVESFLASPENLARLGPAQRAEVAAVCPEPMDPVPYRAVSAPRYIADPG